MLVKQKRQDGGSAGWAFKDKWGHATARRQLFYLLVNKGCPPPADPPRKFTFCPLQHGEATLLRTGLRPIKKTSGAIYTKDLKVIRLTNLFFSDFRAYDEDTNDTEETYKVRERFSPI